MTATWYAPLQGDITTEQADELTKEYYHWGAVSSAFLAGPGVDREANRQAIMRMFNKAEGMGLITIPEQGNDQV